jgi:hypothetical protein
MAEAVGSVRANLSTNSAEFEAGMKRARDAVRSNAQAMERAMEGVKKKFGEAATAINRFGGVALVGAAAAATAFVKQQINVADQMGKLAQQTGTTSEFLSSMGLVASQTGTSLETIAKSTQRLSMNMMDAGRGTGEARHAFEDLNLTLTTSEGTLRNAEDVLLDIAEKFSGMEDGAEKTAMAMRIFGRQGAELIPMLNQGRDGIEDLRQKAEEMGLVISTKTAQQAAYLNDQLDMLRSSALGAGRSIALDLVPWLNDAVDVIKFAYNESGTLMAAWVALGAVGSAIFGKSTQRQINETRARIEELTEAQEKGARVLLQQGELTIGRSGVAKVIEEQLASLRAELAELEAQKEREGAAEQRRIDAAIQKAQEEAEARRKATEEIIRQREARIAAGAAAAEQEAAEKRAIQQAQAAQKAIEDHIKALEFRRDTLGMANTEIELYRLKLMGATEAEREHARVVLEAVDAAQAKADAETRAAQVIESIKTPQERYNDTLRELEALKPHLTIEQYTRALENAREALVETTKTGEESFDRLERAIEGWGRSSADAFVDFARTGKASFSDLVDSIINDLMRMMVYKAIFGPMFGAIGDVMGPMFGGGRARGGHVSAGRFYEVNERGAELLTLGNKQFLMMGKQSGYVTPSGGGGGGGGVTINVVNNAGADVKTREVSDGHGGTSVEVLVDRAVGKKMGEFGSSSNRALRNAFGLNQTLTGR